MPRLFLRRANPTFFIGYQGVIVAALGTGITSAMADSTTDTPPILAAYYDFLSINTWGWILITVGVVLVVGLFNKLAATIGLFFLLMLLIMRLGFQVQEAISLGLDESWRELLPTVAGLPILYAFVSGVLSLTMEPFTYIDPTNPDVTVIVNGNGHEEE